MMQNRSRIAMTAVLFLTLIAFTTTAYGEKEDGKCMSCHGQQAIKEKGSHLYIEPSRYKNTVHSRIGCHSCHDRVSLRHPYDGLRPPRANCRDCHEPIYREYGESLHVNKAGCNDCHNPHNVKSLFSLSGNDISTQCYKCHEKALLVKSHSQWLPQAELHVEAMPCVTCHTSSPNYVILLYIMKREKSSLLSDFTIATYEDLKNIIPSASQLDSLVDTNGDGIISLTELTAFNKRHTNLRIFGTMMPETMTHNYQILDNRWDCTFCHASGPKALQTSYLAIPENDRTYKRLPVTKGAILDILYGTPDFYMLGTTRSPLLSIIGALIALSGLMVPVVHGSLRLLTIKKRKNQDKKGEH